MAHKYVYRFDEGGKDMKTLLGGKGANLAEMTVLGLPVPPGFTITTEVCIHYADTRRYQGGVEGQVKEALAALERDMGKQFGDPTDPLLLSVRSGARASMPGMMDTVLNLGLNDTTVQGLIAQTGNPRFAWDSYRRFVTMYGDVVLGLKPEGDEGDPFEERLEQQARQGREVRHRAHRRRPEGAGRALQGRRSRERTGEDFPEDPDGAALGRGSARSSARGTTTRAIAYRRLYDIPDEWGTAVNVQTMVFGNTGDESGTGVAFTRDPATGENVFYGEFLDERAGRGRGGRHPHAAARSTELEGGHPRRPTTQLLEHRADARAALPRHAGHRVHHRGRPALDAADPQRQAHRPRGHPHRRRHGRRGTHRARRRR